MLPAGRRDSYDGMAELFTSEDEGLSQCGALLSLSGPFGECIEAMELDAVRALLMYADNLFVLSFRRRYSTHMGADGSRFRSSVKASAHPVPQKPCLAR
jgi:hypothetical protein